MFNKLSFLPTESLYSACLVPDDPDIGGFDDAINQHRGLALDDFDDNDDLFPVPQNGQRIRLNGWDNQMHTLDYININIMFGTFAAKERK